MNLHRQLSLALLTLGVSSFLAYLVVFFSYQSSRLNHPDPSVGRVFPSINHGPPVYLTAVETTGLALLVIVSMLGFVLRATVVRKDYRRYLPSSTGDYLAVIAVAAAYLLLAKFAGPDIAAFAVAHGLVISW